MGWGWGRGGGPRVEGRGLGVGVEGLRVEGGGLTVMHAQRPPWLLQGWGGRGQKGGSAWGGESGEEGAGRKGALEGIQPSIKTLNPDFGRALAQVPQTCPAA